MYYIRTANTFSVGLEPKEIIIVFLLKTIKKKNCIKLNLFHIAC